MLVFNSLKTNAQIILNPFSPPSPSELQWLNYLQAWEQGNYGVTMRNSLFIVIGTVIGVLVIAGLAAFSLARLKPRGDDYLLLYFLVIGAMPFGLFLFPLFFLWKTFGLVNSLPGLIIILIATNVNFITFLLRSYMIAIPNDFEDAARVDGASTLQVLIYIILPLAWPGFLASGLIVALAAWNEFMLAVTFIHSPELKPVSTGLYAFTNRFGRDWALTSAASMMMIAPSMLLFMVFQRRFIEGFTGGGLKG
jgi:raffinose/stachyose/melibiose transport system permease protein